MEGKPTHNTQLCSRECSQARNAHTYTHTHNVLGTPRTLNISRCEDLQSDGEPEHHMIPQNLQEETKWQKLKKRKRTTFLSPSENTSLPKSIIQPEEREFVVDSDASLHMIIKKDLSDAEMDSLTESCSPTTVKPPMEKCRRMKRIEDILDHESPRKHASSIVAWKALRWLVNTVNIPVRWAAIDLDKTIGSTVW